MIYLTVRAASGADLTFTFRRSSPTAALRLLCEIGDQLALGRSVVSVDVTGR